MDKEAVFTRVIVGIVVIVVVGMVVSFFDRVDQRESDFNNQCVAAGKEIKYTSVAGSNTVRKVCK
jgi:uncharacterized membrane protein YraQ (UPF0718 family)